MSGASHEAVTVTDEIGVVPETGPVEHPAGSAVALESVIGRRVRELRVELGLTTAQLGDEAGLSKAMVSKIENARTSPSLHTLERLSGALGVPLTSLFRGLDEEHEALHVPAGEGLKVVGRSTRAGHKYEFLGSSRGSYKRMEPMLITLEKETEVFPLFQHPGTEWIYMLAGEIEYGYGSARYALEPGDVLQFDGEIAHGPVALNKLPAQFLSVKAFGSIPESR